MKDKQELIKMINDTLDNLRELRHGHLEQDDVRYWKRKLDYARCKISEYEETTDLSKLNKQAKLIFSKMMDAEESGNKKKWLELEKQENDLKDLIEKLEAEIYEDIKHFYDEIYESNTKIREITERRQNNA